MNIVDDRMIIIIIINDYSDDEDINNNSNVYRKNQYASAWMHVQYVCVSISPAVSAKTNFYMFNGVHKSKKSQWIYIYQIVYSLCMYKLCVCVN